MDSCGAGQKWAREVGRRRYSSRLPAKMLVGEEKSKEKGKSSDGQLENEADVIQTIGISDGYRVPRIKRTCLDVTVTACPCGVMYCGYVIQNHV